MRPPISTRTYTLFPDTPLFRSSDERRRGIIVSYCLCWRKPYEPQWLVYPPETARHFDPDLAALVGYAQHRPNLGNVEGRCPSFLLAGDRPEHVAAVDRKSTRLNSSH